MYLYIWVESCIYIYTYLFCVGIEALFLRSLNLECPLWIVNVRCLHFGGQKINLCLLSSILRCFGGPGWWRNCCTIASKGWGQEIGVSFFVFQYVVSFSTKYLNMYICIYIYIICLSMHNWFCVSSEAGVLRGLDLECPLRIVNVRWLHFGGQKINLCLLSSILRCFGGPGWWRNCCTIASKGWGQEIGVSFFVFQYVVSFSTKYLNMYIYILYICFKSINAKLILCKFRGWGSERFKLRMPFVNCEC